MIGLRDVHFAFPGCEPLLKGCNLSVAAGEVVAIAGPNGAGKSTLLRIAAGLEEALHGSVELDGKAVDDWSRIERAKHLAFVPQAPRIPGDWTVREVVVLGDYPHREAPPAPSPLRERLNFVRERFDLSAVWRRKVSSLSGGEAQRVAIARALIQDTVNLVLDEPASHLDIAYQVNLYGRIAGLAALGRSILIATHDLNLSRRFGHRLVLMNGDGVVKRFPARLEEQGALLKEAFGIPFVERELGGIACWFPDFGPFAGSGKTILRGDLSDG